MSPGPDPPSVTPSVTDERVTFIQHALPGLEDGSYELDISQHVDDADGTPISGESLSRTYRFAVLGDRFRLGNPATTIASTFPAPNATGEYTTVLANVVFANPTFPWARAPTQAPPAPAENDADAEADVPTWLAVLVLDDDDVAVHPELALEPVTRVLGDLFAPAAYEHSTLGANYSYFTGATDTKALEVDEAVGDPVQTIDVPLELFADIAPTLGDLALSAHVRRLSVQNKPLTLGAEPPVDALGTFGIVVGTRLPQPDKKSHAYLVSLEGLEAFLPATSAGGTLNDPTLKLDRALRLAVLTYWTFNAKGYTAAFVDRLEQLNGRTVDGPDAPNTNLRLAVADAAPPISTALEAGYIPLDHDLRSAETTVSWYRGPLSPVDAEPTPIDLPVSSPDRALVFDPTTGMIDASLAAAWTIGRLVALQDASFASALYAWKKGLAKAVVAAAERQIIEDVLGELFASAAELEGAPRADSKPLLHNTMALIRAQAAP